MVSIRCAIRTASILAGILFLVQLNGIRITVSEYTAPYLDPQHAVCNVAHNNSSFCVEWDVNLDCWWTHNADWSASYENDTHYCFSRMDNTEKATFFRDLYKVQFEGNCQNMTFKQLWSSGWGADYFNVVDGLLYALESNEPVDIYKKRHWHYAATKKGDHPVCPKKDMSCFFLPISACVVPKEPKKERIIHGLASKEVAHIVNLRAAWAYEYASRPQTWLRRAIYEYSKTVNLTSPCTAIHVRRSDVVLHPRGQARKYHAIQEYVDAAQEHNHSLSNRSIFLLTDDQNAIDEATSQFPEFKWVYLDRPRHRGSQGGFENQTPSNNPKLEVIVILSIFRLVRRCDAVIHSTSGFAYYLYNELRHTNALRIDIDENKDDVHSAENKKTAEISKAMNSLNESKVVRRQESDR